MKKRTLTRHTVMKTPCVATRGLDGCSLTAAEHLRLRKMLRVKTPESVKGVMATLMSTRPTNADFKAVFTDALVAGLLRVGNNQKVSESRIQKWETLFSAVESAPCVTRLMVAVAAKAVTQHDETLYLGNLTALSDAGAEVLAKKQKGRLFFKRLATLSESPGHLALADTLAKEKGYVNLGCLITLSDAAAEVLAQHKGDLDLSGLMTLSDAAAKALAQHRDELNLSGLTKLSDAAANALAKHKGKLSLERLATLSESPGHLALAKALAKQKGSMYLTGLVNLSDAAAKALSQHKGDLHLSGLMTLSDAAAKALAQRKGDLDLSGLATLSDASAQVLAKHKGQLSLYGLNRLSAVAKEALDHHRGNRSIYCGGQQVRVTGGDRKAARAPVPRRLPKKDAEELLKIALSGDDSPLRERISEWSPASLSVLSEVSATEKKSSRILMNIVVAEYLRLSTDEQEEVLERLFSEYTEPLSSLLGVLTKKHGLDREGDYREDFDSYRRGLSISGLKCLPEEAASCLRHYPGSSLDLEGLREISDIAIARLSQFKGHLGLEGLTDLSESALRALENHRDPFHGNGVSLGLSKLSDASAVIIGGFRSGSVYLNNVRRLSDAQAKGLSAYEGSLYLDGLQELSKTAAENLATQKGYLSVTGLRRLSVDAAKALANHKNLWR